MLFQCSMCSRAGCTASVTKYCSVVSYSRKGAKRGKAPKRKELLPLLCFIACTCGMPVSKVGFEDGGGDWCCIASPDAGVEHRRGTLVEGIKASTKRVRAKV